jgi:P-type conjugative transfer protein VirB9
MNIRIQFRRLVALACLLFNLAPASAEQVAMPISSADTRLVVFTFDENNSYEILTKPKAVTDLEFQADERIETIAVGDPLQWEVQPTKSGKHLFIKPKFDDLSTSASIITDKRTYQFALRSGKEKDASKWYQRVTWQYPDLIRSIAYDKAQKDERAEQENKKREDQVAGTGVPVQDLNFGYAIDGDTAFRPTSVFDDGKFTYIRMPAKIQELPALFYLPQDSKETELVNYTVKGDYLVVQRTMERVLLKIGKLEVKITNNKTYRSSWFGSND